MLAFDEIKSKQSIELKFMLMDDIIEKRCIYLKASGGMDLQSKILNLQTELQNTQIQKQRLVIKLFRRCHHIAGSQNTENQEYYSSLAQ